MEHDDRARGPVEAQPLILQCQVIGACDGLIRNVVLGLGEHNTAWFRENRDAPRPADVVRYVADLPSREIVLVDAANLLERGTGSCGSFSAAEYGYHRARRRDVALIIRQVRPDLWHAVVKLDGAIWDPEKANGHA
jgi:hypothetical protein